MSLIELVFWSAILIIAFAEVLWPAWTRSEPIGRRWIANLGLGAITILLSRWVLPFLTAATVAYFHFGLLNAFAAPDFLKVIAGIAALDLTYYWLHRASHSIPILWRLHQVHHNDRDVDFSTGFRHHPLENFITAGVIFTVIAVVGISPFAVLLHQLGRVIFDLASHANIHVPEKVDRALRLFVITPAMHRLHHSEWQPETDSNFTTLFSWWDRLFGTYRAVANDQQPFTLGLRDWPDSETLALHSLIVQPFLWRKTKEKAAKEKVKNANQGLVNSIAPPGRR